MCTTSAANRRWESLLDLAVMLRQEEVDLDELAKHIQNKKSARTGHDDDPRIATLHHKKETGGSHKITSINSRKVLNSTPIQDSVSCRATMVKKRTKRSREAEEQISQKRRRIILHDHHHLLLLDCDARITATWRKPINKFTVKRNSRKLLNRIQDYVSCNAKMKKKASKLMRAPKTKPILSEEIKKHILDFGGCEESVCLVIEKMLFQSDVDPNKCRLSIPHRQVNKNFFNKLHRTEAAWLESEPEGIRVILFGGGGEEYDMSLRNWKSNNMYALVERWNDVCRRDTLKVGQQVQLWCFRRNSHMCFALF